MVQCVERMAQYCVIIGLIFSDTAAGRCHVTEQAALFLQPARSRHVHSRATTAPIWASQRNNKESQ